VPAPLLLLTDFGLEDGAVAAMKGAALSVDPTLQIVDLTHDVPPLDVWEGAVRLLQALPWYPPGTVAVAVVDPGVGTRRGSLAVRLRSRQLLVAPDNGLITLLAERLGIDEARAVDEERHRLPASRASHTFHGRDLYAPVGARLASGRATLGGLGPTLAAPVLLEHAAARREGALVRGCVLAVDRRYGHVWSDIGPDLLDAAGLEPGDLLAVTVRDPTGHARLHLEAPLVRTFGDVPEGAPLAYLHSLGGLAVGRNGVPLAREHRIASGPNWAFEARPAAT
jgi:S-adenosylmethionine hydrolase